MDHNYPHAAPGAQLVSRSFDAAQNRRVAFEPIVEPILLGPETDQ
jgi:hypothetical protein